MTNGVVVREAEKRDLGVLAKLMTELVVEGDSGYAWLPRRS